MKAGDKVVCVTPDSNGILALFKVYTVTKVCSWESQRTLKLEETDCSWVSSRFILLDSPDENTT